MIWATGKDFQKGFLNQQYFLFQASESENESVRSDPHSFVNHYANVNDSLRQSWKRQKPVRNYSSYTDSEPEGNAVMSLNGGQIIMNNMARSRAPLPGFSSFVWHSSSTEVIDEQRKKNNLSKTCDNTKSMNYINFISKVDLNISYNNNNSSNNNDVNSAK